MSVDVHMSVYNYDELCEQIRSMAEPEQDPDYFIWVIMPKFGVHAGESFITIWNELYEDYNNHYGLMRAAELYFGKYKFLDGYKSFPNQNVYDVLDELGIEYEVNDDEY